METQYKITKASWNNDETILRSLRNKINVLELRTPSQIEFDEKDAQAHHVIVFNDNTAVGCGRLTSTGVISRICVLPSYRCLGLGALVLKGLVDLAKETGMVDVTISAKLDTVDFYTQYGFKAQGNVFMHAGLPRQHVVSNIDAINFFQPH